MTNEKNETIDTLNETIVKALACKGAAPWRDDGTALGVCATCGKRTAWRTVGRDVWSYCESHGAVWSGGSGWLRDTWGEGAEANARFLLALVGPS